jgi:choline monooxygenase
VRLQVWRGFVFVNIDGEAGPLEALVAPLGRLMDERGVTVGPATLRRSHDLACNWKTYVENYLEGYHIDVVHPGLAAEVDTASYNVRMDGAVAVHEVATTSGVNDGLWAWLWPNLAFNVYRYGLMVEHMQPVGQGRTRLDYLYFYDPATADMDAVLAASDTLTLEDKVICEAVQKNFDAGVYDRGVLSPRHEVGVGWFQNRVAEAIG